LPCNNGSCSTGLRARHKRLISSGSGLGIVGIVSLILDKLAVK
jgi:hypothetical protein